MNAKHTFLAAILFPLSFAPLTTFADASTTLHAGAGSRIWLEGDSTLHRYQAEAKKFSVDIGLDSAASSEQGLEGLVRDHHVQSMEVIVPVESLSSGEGGLDENLRHALKAEKFPEIRFELSSYEVTPAATRDGAFGVQLHGELSVAGVKRPVTFSAQANANAKGLTIKGSVPVKMSDHEVKAPVLMLGAIKTDDRVVVEFAINFAH
jgi:polyisoprenoid-binding protein YceI